MYVAPYDNYMTPLHSRDCAQFITFTGFRISPAEGGARPE